MKLATINDGTRDGALVVVAKDMSRTAPAADIARTLQQALDSWNDAEPRLRALADAVEAGTALGVTSFDQRMAMAPLPRAWQWLDGSAYDSHGELMTKAFGKEPVKHERPLMYQGVSDRFHAPFADVPFVSEEDGIDFEGEFGVIVGNVPMGTTVEQARECILLLVQINDWSLRTIAPVEMATGFGWIQAKPPCGMAPLAVTPDELGPAWRDGQIDLTLCVDWNGRRFGAANGRAMSSSFPELVAHAARTRPLCAGTIIGSGTVSNANYREVGSSCIAERRGIELMDYGQPRTEFMKFGDAVRMEAMDTSGNPVFGTLEQRVVQVQC